ncbi:tRNA (adenosine(37)-N6)-threonylcarbamoyltransferase complex dimerization subunit type 1 TsaB [Maribacter hydrothermalis]|uniref:tRNA N6-adenosine(37)-N6-threonylcarbamoyltransferase complex dimerization subunit TsaB n=1 Tax=Maribacter hydrothermalis TaxID=1836467 RepID=A0A1B7ZFV5_9FLAO|nr:tRNA (adenosine(37)-N6)-threonylcarbamoyltransferase complex dimerization subunit type 1 TsaB [Maribacter hydrothermalis]APQ17859.1 tRNA (adenosine(37)-N6)-threonylcarbamoyltransferase complex dimerization subunit type 1 TsaB [Maribacter hydrothermalis]OBR42332.1 tRNA N6-adenosine(37)-N6-threonylcarbamoyltransferase complex dimerization subunit TsaB [Maribacter hydrothermalis]
MGILLNLETSSTNCSVCVSKGGEILAIKELNSANYSHAEKLHIFIEDVLIEASLKIEDLKAVAVSKGPGSYTGLRIGVSAAKGLCYALGIPLISISTLKSMASQVTIKKGEVSIPVLDARRMEVYSAVFDENLKEIRETKAELIDENSFKEFINSKHVHFLGSGAEKIRELFPLEAITYHCEIVPSAKEMVPIAWSKYQQKDFEDVAYFEPYYLKDFVLQTKKK